MPVKKGPKTVLFFPFLGTALTRRICGTGLIDHGDACWPPTLNRRVCVRNPGRNRYRNVSAARLTATSQSAPIYEACVGQPGACLGSRRWGDRFAIHPSILPSTLSPAADTREPRRIHFRSTSKNARRRPTKHLMQVLSASFLRNGIIGHYYPPTR